MYVFFLAEEQSKLMLLFILLILACSNFHYVTSDITQLFIDIDPLLDELDDVIASNSTPSSDLLELCTKALLVGSLILSDIFKTVISNNQHVMYTTRLTLYRLETEEIVQKLKQLPIKPQNSEQGFIRDMFQVTSEERNAKYLIVAREYYSEVQFYKDSNDIMKLCEWKVYKLESSLHDLNIENLGKLKIISYYNLEKSQRKDGTPTYVFGRTDMEDGTHVSLVIYGTKPGPEIDGYYQMKLLVIKDLQLLKGLPVVAKTIRNPENGINTVIVPGFTRQIQDHLGIEVDNDILYDDDIVMKYDTETKETIENSDL
ncbi:hypothetical protein I4U23_016431 [Adineta vaga]|nr:hypothetical protein I4U23_016431 [Adineta vaga]